MASFASSATTGGARNLFRISLPSGFVSATSNLGVACSICFLFGWFLGNWESIGASVGF